MVSFEWKLHTCKYTGHNWTVDRADHNEMVGTEIVLYTVNMKYILDLKTLDVLLL